jgi:hypothetical protein
MQSAFGRAGRRRAPSSSTRSINDENYDLRGVNYIAPDQVMPPGETPFAINARRYADNEDESAVAIRTRKGSVTLSDPVGQTEDATEEGTISGDTPLTASDYYFIPFETTSAGALTKIELHLKKTPNTRGYVIIEIFSSSLDLPLTKIAQTSIAPNMIGTSYGDVSAHFMDAPTVTDETTYWIGVRLQELSVGTYYLAQVASGNVHTSEDEGATYQAQTYGVRYKTYISTAGFIRGFEKRYPEVADNTTLFGLGSKLYRLDDSETVPVETGTDLLDGTNAIRMFTIDERTFLIDQENEIRWFDDDTILWDNVPNQPSANGVPVLGMIFENRLLTVPKGDQTRIDFTALYDFESWPVTNFFYPNQPLSPDHITSMVEFREGATIFTKEMKYTLTGSDIKTFQPTPHKGTKGAISHEAVAVGKEAIYFIADDLNVYSWNGTNDTLISRKVSSELKKVLDPKKIRLHLFNNQLRIYYNRNPDNDVNCMLLLDIVDGQWWKDTGRDVMGSMEWTHNSNELVEFSSKAGWLFYGEKGYSDLGKPISFKYWTSYKSYGSGAAKDRIKRFRPIVRPSQSSYHLNVGKDIDFQNRPRMRKWLVDSGGAKWGSFNWGDGTTYGGSKVLDDTSPMSGRGKHTQYRFEHEVLENPVFLLGYIALVKSGRPR